MSEDHWQQIEEAHEEGQWATLLELCEIHLKEIPQHIHARIPQAIALTYLCRFDEAVSLLKQTYGDSNADTTTKHQCQRELGQTFEEMGKFDEARRAYEEAHRLNPKNIIPLIYRGAMELRLGQFAAAREWLNRAIECPEGDFDEAHFNIGSTYLAEQNYPKAIEHYQKAITLDPDYDKAWDRLQDAKRAMQIRNNQFDPA